MAILGKNRRRQIKSGFFSGVGIAVAGMVVAAAWAWLKPMASDLMSGVGGNSGGSSGSG
jgi:hypothetical protein